MTAINHRINLGNIIDVIRENKGQRPLNLHSCFGVSKSRFIAITGRVTRRLEKDVEGRESFPEIIGRILNLIKEYDLNDTEAMLLICHISFNVGFDAGTNWQQEEIWDVLGLYKLLDYGEDM